MAEYWVNLSFNRQNAMDRMKALMDAAYVMMRTLSPDEAKYFDWLKDRVEAIDLEMMQRRERCELSETAKITESSPFNVFKPKVVKRTSNESLDVRAMQERDVQATDPQPVVTLPVTVTEVESLPSYLDHTIDDQLQRRADSLVNWNYRSLNSSRRVRSRRYEGWRR